MGVIVPEDEYQFSLIWTNSLTSKEFTSTIGIAMVSGSPDPPSDVADSLFDNTQIAVTGLAVADGMANGWQFQGVQGFLQTSSGPVLGSHLETINGTGSDNDIPVNCAVIVRKNTDSGGRRNRGRMFLPPYMAGMTVDTDGVFGGATTSFIDGMVGGWHIATLGDGYAMVIHHSDGSAGTPISSFNTQPLFGTQRKRMR